MEQVHPVANGGPPLPEMEFAVAPVAAIIEAGGLFTGIFYDSPRHEPVAEFALWMLAVMLTVFGVAVVRERRSLVSSSSSLRFGFR